jgi:hypothetical protein
MKKFKFALMCAAALALVACGEKNPVDDPNNDDDDDAGYVCPISVTDASDADWANVPEGYLFETKNEEGANKDALKSVKVFADEIYLSFLAEWDTDQVTLLDTVPFHVYLNVDGAAETGGYGDQWLEPFDIDLLMEGCFFLGNEPCAYEPGIFAYGGAYNTNEWNWTELVPASSDWIKSQHLGDNKMEIQMLRELIPAAWGETFTVGFDIQQSWESVGVLPNAPADSIGGDVKAYKMSVNFYVPEE